MLATLKTLIVGEARRAEETVQDIYALELITQKIRESEDGLKAGKATLASLIQRQRAETRQIDGLSTQIDTMTTRTKEALEDGKTALAQEAAEAIATMENERRLRRGTLDRLDEKTTRLRARIEATHRRIIDLKQGEIAARAVRKEARIQSRLSKTLAGADPAQEAQDLIARVLNRDDPAEQADILREIDAGLSHDDLGDRMAAQGYGPSTKTTAADVLARLQS